MSDNIDEWEMEGQPWISETFEQLQAARSSFAHYLEADGKYTFRVKLLRSLVKALEKTEKLETHIAELEAAGEAVAWNPMETAPKNEVVWFWIEPKTAEETIHNSAGPILSNSPPHLFEGRYGTWNALMKAVAWAPIKRPPPFNEGTAPPQADEAQNTELDDVLAWADGIIGCPVELADRVTKREYRVAIAIERAAEQEQSHDR